MNRLFCFGGNVKLENTGGNICHKSGWAAAKNTVHHSKKYLSHIILPIIED